jgi:hypothetical protein
MNAVVLPLSAATPSVRRLRVIEDMENGPTWDLCITAVDRVSPLCLESRASTVRWKICALFLPDNAIASDVDTR